MFIKLEKMDLTQSSKKKHKIKNIEIRISLNKPEKRKHFEQKWEPLLENILNYMVVQQLGGGGVMLLFYFFSMLLFSILVALLLLL